MQGDLISKDQVLNLIHEKYLHFREKSQVKIDEGHIEIIKEYESVAIVLKFLHDEIKKMSTAYDVEKVVEETDKVLADLNVVEVLSHFEPDKTIQMPLSNFLCAFKDEIGRLIRNGGKE